MLQKLTLLAGLALFAAMPSFAQDVKQNLEKVKADPKTAENAAKADVYIHKKNRVIHDSTTTQATLTDKKKNKKCGKRS